jgi:rhodanese-related sulfurtransferase/predicted small metal-binding protein
VHRSPATHQDVPTTVEQLLAAARATLHRLSPKETHAAMRDGAQLIDIRPDDQRHADGTIPGAHVVGRNVLEWRLDPACPHRDAELTRGNHLVVLICHEGFQSSLAAATVQRFGPRPVTDVIGGFRAWRAAGLPVQPHSPKGPLMRAIECPCGHHLEAADDDELFRLAREHIDRDHPEMQRINDDIRARVAADAYDVAAVG